MSSYTRDISFMDSNIEESSQPSPLSRQVLTKELARLENENNKLKQKITELQQQKTECQQENVVMKNTIIELTETGKILRNDNEYYKKRISQLEKENEKLIDDIEKLKREMSSQFKEMKYQIDTLTANHLISKLEFSFQDVNELNGLENKHEWIAELRRNRNSNGHYIRTTDSENLKNYKAKLIYDKLYQAQNNDKVLEWFQYYDNNSISDMIKNLLPYASNDGSSISRREKIHAEKWWDM